MVLFSVFLWVICKSSGIILTGGDADTKGSENFSIRTAQQKKRISVFSEIRFLHSKNTPRIKNAAQRQPK